MKRLRSSVRRMAECLFRTGDLHFMYDAAVLPGEGLAAHQSLASQLGGAPEVRVSYRFEHAGYSLQLSGRIDLLQISETSPTLYEFKSTRSDLERLHAHWAGVHWGQLQLYAAMLLAAAGIGSAPAEALLRLHYVNINSGRERTHERRVPAPALQTFLDAACCAWIERQQQLDAWRDRCRASLQQLAFPHATFRPRQRALSAAAFRAHRDAEALLCEAPTGLGKTLAFVFPALKAIAAGHATRLLYLTARGTGQRSTLDALDTLARTGAALRQVQIVAKEKVCLTPGAACAPESCQYARGYHDREAGALQMLRSRSSAWRADVLEVALSHQVCPFELSLAFAREADVVVCDYNYVLDPFIRSARVLAQDKAHTSVLLDEAHQLPERAQEMHSAALSAGAFRGAARVAHPGLPRLLARIARAVFELGATPATARDQRDHWTADFVDRVVPPDATAALDVLIDRFVARAVALLTPESPELLRNAFQQATAWQAVRQFLPHTTYALIVSAQDAQTVLQQLCVDPAPLVRLALTGFRSVQAFSATLPGLNESRSSNAWQDREASQGSAVATALGLPAPARAFQVPTIFDSANMPALVVCDIDVRYRARDGSLAQVSQCIRNTVAACPGNYLVFLPSYAYLSAQFSDFCSAVCATEPRECADIFAQDRKSVV